MRASDELLRPFRDNRLDLISDYAGDWYGNKRPARRRQRPLNLYFSYLATLIPTCCPRRIAGKIGDSSLADPTGEFDPEDPRFPFSLQFQSMLDRICNDRVHLADKLRRAFFDAQFGLGIIKSGICPSPKIGKGGEDTGDYYAENVDLDDYTVEMAKSRELVTFESNRYERSYLDLMDSDVLKGDAKDILTRYRNGMAPPQEGQDVAALGGINPTSEWNPQVSLRDTYLPRQNRVITTLGEFGQMYFVLAEFEWPEEIPGGPFDTMAFYPISSNIMPVPPALVVRSMVGVVNRLMVAAVRQAERQKSNPIFSPDERKTGETVRNAQDGEVLIGDKSKAGVIETGGLKAETIQAIQFVLQLYNNTNGNPDLLGGISQASDKVTTNQMLMGNANIRTADLRSAVLETGASVYKKVGYFLFTDNDLESSLTIQGKHGAIFHQPHGWHPKNRQGQFSDYGFGLDVYPGRDDSPDGRYKAMSQWTKDFLIPLLPMAQDQGVQEILRESARIAGVPGADSLFSNPQAISALAQNMPGQTSQPAQPNITVGSNRGVVPQVNQAQPKPQQPQGATDNGQEQA